MVLWPCGPVQSGPSPHSCSAEALPAPTMGGSPSLTAEIQRRQMESFPCSWTNGRRVILTMDPRSSPPQPHTFGAGAWFRLARAGEELPGPVPDSCAPRCVLDSPHHFLWKVWDKTSNMRLVCALSWTPRSPSSRRRQAPASCCLPDVPSPFLLPLFGDTQLFVRLNQGSDSGTKYLISITSLFPMALSLVVTYARGKTMWLSGALLSSRASRHRMPRSSWCCCRTCPGWCGLQLRSQRLSGSLSVCVVWVYLCPPLTSFCSFPQDSCRRGWATPE